MANNQNLSQEFAYLTLEKATLASLDVKKTKSGD